MEISLLPLRRAELPLEELHSVACGALHSGPSHCLLRPFLIRKSASKLAPSFFEKNLYPTGPSPYPCPGVDTSSGGSSARLTQRLSLENRVAAELLSGTVLTSESGPDGVELVDGCLYEFRIISQNTGFKVPGAGTLHSNTGSG